jgi:acetate kinase
MNILSINPGSSSLKFAVHSVEAVDRITCVSRGTVEGLGTPAAVLRTTSNNSPATSMANIGLAEAISRVISNEDNIEAVGCRVVHGGSAFGEPTVIEDGVVNSIRALAPLAPLHNARDLEAIEAARKALPKAKLYAVFDTAFHRTIPAIASTYALPRELAQKHQIRHYGFHGISYQYSTELLRAKLGSKARRLVICHLGNGASVCAVLDGTSVDTSMGMTPLEGLVMGTRSGDIDPGIILFLQRELGLTTSAVDEMLNFKSGLLGLSGLSGEVQVLEQAAGNADAELALNVFAYRVAKYVGSYAAALGGLDAVAFTGGIGEHSADVRSRVCRHLSFLGVSLDESQNQSREHAILRQIGFGDKASVWVVAADEERQIAQEVYRVLAKT